MAIRRLANASLLSCNNLNRIVFLLEKKVIARSYFTYSQNPNHYPRRQSKWTSAEEAVSVIKSGNRLYVQAISSTPRTLVAAMVHHAKASGLKNLSNYLHFMYGDVEYLKPEYQGIFSCNIFFVSPSTRDAVNTGKAHYVPIFITDIPLFLHQQPVDVALVQVSPPDERGFCSLGGCVESTRAAIETAKCVIAQVNSHQIKTFGDSQVHVNRFDFLVEGHHELPELQMKLFTKEDLKIGKLIADNLVDDGATLQTGIGSIPDAVLASLKNHRSLGIHTEMFSDGVVDLFNSGVITNEYKTVIPGKIVASFTLGSKKLYKFLNNNISVEMRDISFTNNTGVIASNHKMVAINSCIEIDLAGEVAADCIGSYIYSGLGGQVDFLRGTAESLDRKGKPVIVLHSRTNKGQAKIVPHLKPGSAVVSTRGHVHYVVTEYGIANLFGKTLRHRAYELIRIAHPDDREKLERAAFDRFKCMPSP
ncbi:4-hydroxybutyrate coenzyme A transferase-like [Centruroides vittatus]|uniref:4-hydroxybutyrate coenzyme A transferase-like n=1 Tax=Centruroides vittatus TaxID=120091 RepID=UPI00350FC280